MLFNCLLYGFFSLVLSLVCIPIFRKIAFKIGIVDVPDGKVKVHMLATPYLGGVAIFLIVGLLSGILAVQEGFDLLNGHIGVVVGLTLLALTGFIDDMVVITPLQKIYGQALAAIMFVVSGHYLHSAHIPLLLTKIVSFIWFILISNAINLVDIMDGLAGIIVFWSLVAFAFIAYGMHSVWMVTFIAMLTASVVGFLWYNKPRATIYLGDSGALFLGGVLSLMPFLLSVQHESNAHIFLTSILILGIPIAETFFLIIIRSYKKILFYQASPHHFKCYLMKKKWSEWGILALVSFFAVSLNFVAFAFFYEVISCSATIMQLAVLLFFATFVIYR